MVSLSRAVATTALTGAVAYRITTEPAGAETRRRRTSTVFSPSIIALANCGRIDSSKVVGSATSRTLLVDAFELHSGHVTWPLRYRTENSPDCRRRHEPFESLGVTESKALGLL